jgi:pimeloyl-ACP methyl ester carboxylesterase
MTFSTAQSLSNKLLLVGFAALLCFPSQSASAQERYAAFIHGFSFGDDRPEANDQTLAKARAGKAARWEESGTPQSWKGSTIDGYVYLKYFDRDLYETPFGEGNLGRDITLDDHWKEMMGRFVDKMQSKAPADARWVLVGHSQGGIVARLLHEYVREENVNLNIEGVAAVDSPMQGAQPTTVAYGDKSDYKNAKPTIDGLMKDVLRAPIGEITNRLLHVFGWRFVYDFASNFVDIAEYEAEGVISLASDRIRGRLHGMAVNKKAQVAIGPGGYLITKINNAPDPDNYRALLGAERAPTGPRIASAAPLNEAKVPSFSALPFLLEGPARVGTGVLALAPRTVGVLLEGAGRHVEPGEESETVDMFNDVHDEYRDNADWYRWRCYLTFGISCVAGDYRRWERWKTGREALQGFDQTYGKILNAFRLKRKVGERTVCPDTYGSGSRVARRFEPPTAQEYVDAALEVPDENDGDPTNDDDGQQDDDDGAGGNECHVKSYTYYVSVPNKHDGLLGVNYLVWDSNSPAKGGPELGDHSVLYSDEPGAGSSGSRRGGTGFNHGEVVYNERRYSSSDDPGIDDGAFNEGDPNPTMQDAETWIRRQVFD